MAVVSKIIESLQRTVPPCQNVHKVSLAYCRNVLVASWASLLRSVWYTVGVWRYASGERLILVQTDMQTDIDMDTNMAADIGVKSVYIRAFRPREISQSTSLSSIQSNSPCCMCTCIVSLSTVCWLVRSWCFVWGYAWSVSGSGRAAHIKIVQTHMQNRYGYGSLYIYGPWALESSQSRSHQTIQVTVFVAIVEGRTVWIDTYIQRREKEKDSRYIWEVYPLLPAPLAVSFIYTCNSPLLHICMRVNKEILFLCVAAFYSCSYPTREPRLILHWILSIIILSK